MIKIYRKNTQNEETQILTHALASILYYLIYLPFVFFLSYSIDHSNKFQMKVKIALCWMYFHRVAISWVKASPGAPNLRLNAKAEEECLRPRMKYLNIVKETDKNNAKTDKPKYKNGNGRKCIEREERKKCHKNPKERKIHVIVMHMHKNTSYIVYIIIMYVIYDMWAIVCNFVLFYFILFNVVRNAAVEQQA